jgi:UDP-glucose:(heptosyl)LPS alpha-1,3-glucosyltransferase
MDLAFATFKYYPFGGLEQSMRNIALEVLRRGHSLTLYCHSWQGECFPNAKLEVLPVKKLTNHGEMLAFHQQFQRRLLLRKHDFVVGFKRMPNLDLYYNGDVCYRSEMASKHNSLVRVTPRYKVLSRFENAIFSKDSSTHVMYIAEREKRIFQTCYGTPDSRFHALPPGIDKARIRDACSPDQRRQVRNSLGETEDSLILLMVGSDFRRKGVDRAIHAIAALPSGLKEKSRLWVVGKGDPAPYCKLAEKYGIGKLVRFIGPRDDVPLLLSAADILMHPALTETAGNAILEGLVAGVPVIVSESAGFSVHVAKAGGGRVVSDTPWRQNLLDQALLDLVGDKALRSQLGRQGWHYADVTDLYRRPQVATDIIENLAKEKINANLAG